MKQFILIVYIFTLILASSCKDASIKKHPKTVFIKDSIVVDVPSDVPKVNASNSWSIYKEYFSFSSKGSNSSTLYNYNFSKNSWSYKKYTYPDDNGIISDAHFLMTDSLDFFNPKKKSNNLLIFYKDSLIKKEKINKLNELVSHYKYLPDLQSKAHFKIDENKLYFPILYAHRINTKSLSDRKLYGIYYLNKDSVSFHGRFPDDFTKYSNLLINNLHKNIAVGKKRILVNFPKLPYLLVYDKKNNFIKKLLCSNEHVLNISSLAESQNKNIASIKNHFSGNYDKVLYNKQNNVFYRISTFYKNYDRLDFNRLLQKAYQLKRTRVQVLNENLETIAVNDFKGLNEHFIFLKKGALFMMSGEDQPDKLVFKKFQLSP